MYGFYNGYPLFGGTSGSSGGGGADVDGYYVLTQSDAGLPNSSVLTPGVGIAINVSGGLCTVLNTVSGSGTGSVTSFSAGNLQQLFTTSVANPNSTPALTFSQISQNGNLIYASPSGGAGNPSFRALLGPDLTSALEAGNNITLTSNGSALLIATVNSGTVFSVGLSMPSIFTVGGTNPITGSGSFNVTLANENANLFFVGPASGSSAGPTFRGIVGNDIVNALIAGSGITLVNQGSAILVSSTATSSSSGTVASVSCTSLSPLFSTTVANASSTPAISFTLTPQACGTFLRGPSAGANAAPTFGGVTGNDLSGVLISGTNSSVVNNGSTIQVNVPNALGGTVTSVTVHGTPEMSSAGNPITGSGTVQLGWNSESANLFMAAPSAGSGIPGFRALTGNDLVGVLVAGSDIQLTNNGSTLTITASAPSGGSSGTVTSVAMSVPPALLSLTGSPITGAGTLAVSLVNASSTTLWAGPSAGAAGSPGYRGLTGNDIPLVSGTNTTVVNNGATLQINVPSPSYPVTSVSNSDGTLTISPSTGAVVASIANSAALPGSPTTTTQSSTDNSTKIATTSYVTTAVANAIAGVNPAVAVQVATVSSSDTSGLTYNNGVSGVGATFTGSTNTALTFDGVTLTSLNQRVLVKNDTQSGNPGAYNGIYTLTQLQTVGLPPILTRAVDYDQPSDINNTGAIPVVSGTVNADTSWLLTSTVATVGTSVLTYTQFTLNPSSIVTGAGNLTPLFTTSTSGNTISFSLTNASAHTVYCNTSGSSAAPGFNALTLTAGNGLTGGGNITTSPTVSVSLGGSSTYTSGALVYASSTTALSGLAPTNGGVLSCASSIPVYSSAGSSGQLLQSNGTSAPSFTTNTWPSTDTKGDLIYASANNQIAGLAIGATNSFLISNGTLPVWTSAQNALNELASAGGTPTNGQTLIYSSATENWTPGSGSIIPSGEVGGRIYLVSGSPLVDGASGGNSTIYYGPYTSNVVTIGGTTQTFSEASLALSTSASAYWVYVKSAGTSSISLGTAAWTNNTTPSTTYSLNGQIYADSGHTELIVGGIYCPSASSTQDWPGARCISNIYNPIHKILSAVETSSNWSTSSASWSTMNGSTTIGTQRVIVFCTIPTPVNIETKVNMFMSNQGNIFSGLLGLALDSVSVSTAKSVVFGYSYPGGPLNASVSTNLVGFHYFQNLQAATDSGTATFYGGTGQVNSAGPSDGYNCYMLGNVFC